MSIHNWSGVNLSESYCLRCGADARDGADVECCPGEAKPCPFCGGPAKTNTTERGRTFAWCPKCCTSPTPIEDWNKRAPHDPVPRVQYLLGYSAAVLRAARDRADKEYRNVIDDCGDMREAWRHAQQAIWPNFRSPKTRDDLDRWTLEAQKEADGGCGLVRFRRPRV